MRKLAALWRIATSWYVSLVFAVAIGIVIGYFAFFEAYPGKPKIGFVDIPFTVLTDDSVFTISAYLDYARRNGDIKATVIRITSPGGGAAASEWAFLEMLKLRAEKPVVMVMGDIVASGAYMMSLGANHTYAKPTSIVGSVGVILSFPGPFIPDLPGEQIVPTGPHKLEGGSRRHWIELLDQVKQGFAEMVFTERGDKLRISRNDLLEGRLYAGIEGVRLGLVDEIGGDTEAIEKAASLAGISSYEMVDVNVEVARIFNEKSKRIREPLESGRGQPGLAGVSTLMATSGSTGDSASPLDELADLNMLRRPFLPTGISEIRQDRALAGLPLEMNTPRIYYLYVGPSQ